MSDLIHIKIVSEDTVPKLNASVNRLVLKGWTPLGEMFNASYESHHNNTVELRNNNLDFAPKRQEVVTTTTNHNSYCQRVTNNGSILAKEDKVVWDKPVDVKVNDHDKSDRRFYRNIIGSVRNVPFFDIRLFGGYDFRYYESMNQYIQERTLYCLYTEEAIVMDELHLYRPSPHEMRTPEDEYVMKLVTDQATKYAKLYLEKLKDD